MPQRRCAGCGRIASKAELVRLTLARERRRDGSATVVIDDRSRLGGRGAYLCASAQGVPRSECLERAVRRGGIARTLRRSVKIDSSDLLGPLPAGDVRPGRSMVKQRKDAGAKA